MKQARMMTVMGSGLLAILFLLIGTTYALAHCDGLDGPVVKAAQRALQTSNVNLVLIWVQGKDEPEIKAEFQRTHAVRTLGPEAMALADRHFFETLVRIHRSGEGAAYTGLKPAGRDLGPAIPAADRALETGGTAALETLIEREVRDGIRQAFTRVQASRKYNPNDVAAGREYVKAYVEYVHYMERLHDAASHPAAGHYAETQAR